MKKAFTMLELVFVIVAIGILAATVIPNTKTNPLQEAATQLVSHIRYTQHLAMIDDKFDSNDSNWYKKRWSIRFNSDNGSEFPVGTSREAYTIFADTTGVSDGNANLNEVARNPENTSSVLSGGITGPNALRITDDTFQGIKKMNLGLSYSISDVVINGGCNNQSFGFDHLGRPINSRLNTYTNAYRNNDLIQSRCNIILISSNPSDGNITIAIEPETGYAHIL